jgi:hypothetical protein
MCGPCPHAFAFVVESQSRPESPLNGFADMSRLPAWSVETPIDSGKPPPKSDGFFKEAMQ